MKINPLPSLEYLNECFVLDTTCPSGLRWKVRPQSHFDTEMGYAMRNGKDAGKPAGKLVTDLRWNKQYYSVKASKINYLTHRIVYSLYNNVELSTDIEIDHEDGNSLNNNPFNLRRATHNENQHNATLRKDNSSGFKGVIYHKASKGYRFQYYIGGKRKSFGAPTPEQAYILGCEIRDRLHKEFANHG